MTAHLCIKALTDFSDAAPYDALFSYYEPQSAVVYCLQRANGPQSLCIQVVYMFRNIDNHTLLS